jgi:ribosomal protein L12E/L44/L45/RPP1/RPP2
MARFATPWTVDAFETGVDGLVITPAGTDVPDEQTEAVRESAAYNGVELIEVTEDTPAQPVAVPSAAVPPAPKVEEMQSAPATRTTQIEEAGA